VGSYLAYRPKIYPKVHENPRAFSCISGSIYLESSIQCPCGVGLHQNQSKILEKLDSNAQKLTNLQITIQDLMKNIEINEKTTKGKSVDFGGFLGH